MCELYGYSGTYFYLNNHELLIFFSYYKIIYIYIFLVGKPVIQISRRKKNQPRSYHQQIKTVITLLAVAFQHSEQVQINLLCNPPALTRSSESARRKSKVLRK